MKRYLMTAAFVATALSTQAVEWMTDYHAALQRAEKEGKAVLVDFTGSDWCHFCNVLRRRVLDTPAFEAYGADKFVYLEVDLPRRNSIPPELRKQNNELVKQYRVGGFPTVLVLDARGHALGGFTGGMTRLPDVIKALDPAVYVHRQLLGAQRMQGAERAAALQKAYLHYPDNYRAHNAWLREELEKLDAQDATGWKIVYRAELQMEELQRELEQHITDRPTMLSTFDRYIAAALPGNRARMLRLKEHYLTGLAAHKLRTARSVEDVLEAKELQLQAAECCENPSERAEIRRRIEEVYADPQSLILARRSRTPRP